MLAQKLPFSSECQEFSGERLEDSFEVASRRYYAADGIRSPPKSCRERFHMVTSHAIKGQILASDLMSDEASNDDKMDTDRVRSMLAKIEARNLAVGLPELAGVRADQ